MFIGTFKTIYLALIYCTFTNCEEDQEGYNWQDNGVVLTAAELANLVRLEQGLVASDNENKHKEFVAQTRKTTANVEEPKHENTLRGRKVWSRWSKWSKCSNTCGPGTMTRRRLCVAGRCAPGEKEEQHRSCEMTPCKGQEVTAGTVANRIDVPTEVDFDPDALE